MSAFRKRRNCPRRVCIQVRRRPVLAWSGLHSSQRVVRAAFRLASWAWGRPTDRPKAQRSDEDGAWLILRCDDGHLLLSIKGLALLHGLSVRSDTYKQLSTIMKFLVALAALVAVASAGVITPLSTISRAPAFDSAVIQSDRIGGNFAYSTAENHAYAVNTPIVQNVQTPVAVSYSAPAIAAYAAPAYAHGYAAYAPAAAYTHGYAAGPAVLAL